MNATPHNNHSLKTLPSGTVTFLFTDIEGSTRLLQKLGDQYALVLATQRQVLRDAFETWRGCEVDTQGDAFFVAFSRASDAISAAARAQERVAAQSWPEGLDIKIRMGLHTGEAQVTGEGYVGMDVHRASRICSAGHGGQILISPSTAALVMNSLPEGLRLRDLGEHRLKDLSYPEHLFQLDVRGQPYDFPPLKSLNVLPNNLPVQLTSFVGRQDEIEQLKNLLHEARLITITGPGGSGKSRLSLQVAADLIDNFADGVWLVPLVSLTSVDEIPDAIANALHFRIEYISGNVNLATQLLDYLSTRSMLLVLDNFEHLLPGAAFLSDMLVRAPEVRLLLTSRETLNIPGEWIFSLQGLSYPHDGHKDGNGAYSALILFQERARQANPAYSLSQAERPFATTICHLVGGIPLAIELAAPWTAILSCQEIAREIEHNLDFLAGTLRGIPEGHRSLRAVFEHSWNLLDDSERNAFCNLAVFQGGFDRLAAREVAELDLPLLMDLANKSLVQRGEGDRFQLHPLLHQFALERLYSNPLAENAVRDRHSRYYLKMLEQWQVSKPGDAWLPVLEKMLLENGNFRQMIRWALINWDEQEARHALNSLGPIYLAQGFYVGSNTYQSIIAFLRENGASLDADTPLRSLLLNAITIKAIYDACLGDPAADRAASECESILRQLDLKYELGSCLYSLGISAETHSEHHKAIQLLEESLQLLEDSDPTETRCGPCIWLGWAYHELGDYDKAKYFYEKAYRISREQGVGAHVPYALDKLGLWADDTGNNKQGLQYHQEALQTFRILGAQSGQAYALSRMSVSARELGDFELALQYAQEGFECFKDIGHRWGIATSLSRIGYAELSLHRYAEARAHYIQGLKFAQQNHMPGPSIYALIGLAILEARQGNPKQAVEMLTVAINHPVIHPSYKANVQKELVLLKEKLGAKRFSASERRGKTVEFQTLVDELIKQ